MIDAKETINIVLTGGTIDSRWDGKSDTVVPVEHSIVPDFLRGLKLYLDLQFTEVCMKDSRSLSHEDLERILKTIQDSPAKKFVVTHGTYTMADTARFIEANLKDQDKTVVLTGSSIPLKGFDSSDAQFNLGFALSQAQSLQPGVYLAMNGVSFMAKEAAKNISEGQFYSIFQEKQ